MLDSRQVRAALRALRMERGWTPEEMADRTGVSRATIYRMDDMADDYSPKLDTVMDMLEAIGVAPAAFFSSLESGSDLPGHSAGAYSGLPNQGGVADVRIPLQELAALRARITRLEHALQRIAGHAKSGSELAERALADQLPSTPEHRRRTPARKVAR